MPYKLRTIHPFSQEPCRSVPEETELPSFRVKHKANTALRPQGEHESPDVTMPSLSDDQIELARTGDLRLPDESLCHGERWKICFSAPMTDIEGLRSSELHISIPYRSTYWV